MKNNKSFQIKLKQNIFFLKWIKIYFPILIIIILLFTQCITKQKIVIYKEGQSYGIKSNDGKIIVKPEFNDIRWDFYGKYLEVRKNRKYGIVDNKGKLIIDTIYDYVSVDNLTKDGLIEAKLNGKVGFLDKKGRVVIPFKYTLTWGFRDGLARVQKDGLWGFINKKGKEVITIIYRDIYYAKWSEGLIGAQLGFKWGFINKKNKTIIPFEYYEVGTFSEGLVSAAKSYKEWGYIDHKNRTILPFKYEYPYYCDWKNGNFKNGLAQFRLNDKSGIIDKKGNVIIPNKYRCIESFENGFAFIEIDNCINRWDTNCKILYYGYIDIKGKEYIIPYKDFSKYDWNVEKAPKEIPDLSDTLEIENIKNYPSSSGGVLDNSSVYDGAYVKVHDSVNKKDTSFYIYDTITYQDLLYVDTIVKYAMDTTTLIDNYEYKEEKKDNKPNEKWTLEKMLNHSLNAFVDEPMFYHNYNNLTELCISYALQIGEGPYTSKFRHPTYERWEIFKKGTIYKIISTEYLREIVWNWIKPYYKKAFKVLHPFHQQTYKNIAKHLKNYINNYNIEKVSAYLRDHENRFAHYDINGKYNPYRKMDAFVDRLILVHKLISVEDAKTWINKIADDVEKW